MTSYTAGKLKQIVNRHSSSFESNAKELSENIILSKQFDSNNKLFSLEIDGEGLVFKSEPLRFFPQYEQKLVTDGESVYWRGQFFFIKPDGDREPLSSIFIDIHGRVSINSTSDWEYGVQSSEIYAELTSSLFDAAINHKLITP